MNSIELAAREKHGEIISACVEVVHSERTREVLRTQIEILEKELVELQYPIERLKELRCQYRRLFGNEELDSMDRMELTNKAYVDAYKICFNTRINHV